MEKINRVIIDNVSKKFLIGRKNNIGTLARILSLFSGKEPKRLIYVLKNLAFNVYSGEIMGIIGRNGSGKSTLLRTIAGIYCPDGGRILIKGKVISIINLVSGMKDRLTMKENIFLCCSLFGITQKETKMKLKNIIEFSGLEKFIDTKIYQFSEGMKERLSFSIAVNCNPDILLLDEVFEISDEDFKKRSLDKIKELAKNGAAIVLASHELDKIEGYCDRIIWMDNGKINKIGEPREVINSYKLISLVS